MNKSKQETKQLGQRNPEQMGLARRLRGFSSVYKVLFIALCCPILLFTVIGMLAPQHSTHAAKAGLPVFPSISITTILPTSTTIALPSPTPTSLPTPPPTPTPMPTPSPTPTQAPTPSPQPRVTPTQQAGPTVTPTSSNQIPPFATPPPNTVATVPVGLSPTPSPDATAASDNGSGLPSSTPAAGLTPGSGDNQNSIVPDNNTNSNASTQNPPFLILGSLAAGLLLLVAVAIFLVKKLLEPMMEPVGLPPSGARPWSRTPGPSMDGSTNLYSWENAATGEQSWANDPFAESHPAPFANQNPSFTEERPPLTGF